MSSLTNYYLLKVLEKNRELKTKRFDCLQSTGDYKPFELLASKSKTQALYCYLGTTEDGSITSSRKRLADIRIYCKGNISSIYMPDIERPDLGFGDINYTNDAAIFHFIKEDMLAIYIAKGAKNLQHLIYDRFKENDLEKERLALIHRAAPYLQFEDNIDEVV